MSDHNSVPIIQRFAAATMDIPGFYTPSAFAVFGGYDIPETADTDGFH
jgi:hypothetical protein